MERCVPWMGKFICGKIPGDEQLPREPGLRLQRTEVATRGLGCWWHWAARPVPAVCWPGGDGRVERTAETTQTQPQPCRATPGATGEGPCVWESPDVSLSDEFKAFSFSVFINGEWPLVVGTDRQATGWLFHPLEPQKRWGAVVYLPAVWSWGRGVWSLTGTSKQSNPLPLETGEFSGAGLPPNLSASSGCPLRWFKEKKKPRDCLCGLI